ncbi:MAG TPA: glutathione S-transferase family protein [Pseudomonadales bacterium]|nr:glutathione S-transferase family protein [Pseudomonadales bacterium]
MELYGSYTSPFVRHIRIVLLENNIPFTLVETDAAGSAKLSPTQKVPFLKYSEHGQQKMLTDSSAILKYVRECSGDTFFNDARNTLSAFNTFCTANTLLDTAINLFYLEKDGVTAQQSAYVARQQSRLHTGLAELDKMTFATQTPYNDGELRIACFIDWALFRNRFTLDGLANLQRFLNDIRQCPHFAATAPKA